MPKMKLLLNTSEDEPAVQAQQRLPRAVCAPAGPHRPAQSPLNKETVFEWFGLHLDPVRRLEFMCGLLHMCQPLELRFLGSYLEDLARKDYHILRDFECRANSPSELGNLTDVNDPVVRSKMLVCLSLLGSDSRECAGILFQTLGRVEPAHFYKTSDYCFAPSRVSSCQDGREAPVDGGSQQTPGSAVALEQLALLFTMASLHPAFHFHQRQMLRAQLDKIHFTVEEQRRSLLRGTAQNLEPLTRGEDHVPLSTVNLAESAAPHTACQSHRFNCEAPQEAVHIERIVLKGITRTKVDREYNFEVTWSDSSCSSVTKTHMELENFLLKLPKNQCNKSFERGLLQLMRQEENKRTEELLRNHFLSAPPVFTQSTKVWCFFTSDGGRCPGSGSRQAYHEPGTDGSSQDEEPFVQDYKKKHRNKSPSLESPVVSVAAKRGESESTSRTQASHRGKGKPKGTPNGTLSSTLQWNADAASGPDTLGESSSERSSVASSPQHRATDSPDSEEDQLSRHGPPYTDSLSDRAVATLTVDPLSPHNLHTHMEPMRTDCTDVSALSFMPYALPPGAPSFAPGAPPHPPGALSLSKPGPGPVRMHLPPAVTGPGLMMEPEKGDLLPTFGVSSMNLPAPESSAMQPLVQRFKALSHGATPPSAPPAPLPAPIRAGTMPTSLPSLSANLQPSLPCPETAAVGNVPLVETSHAKLPALNLPYPLAPAPTSVMTSVEMEVAAAPVQGLLQAVPPVVPTHTPGPAPSPSPALTPSMAHSNCTSSSPSVDTSGDGQGQRAPPVLSCGMCGCQCGGRPVSASPLFFHQVSAGARPLLGMPHLFPFTNYLPQAQATHQPQPNGTTLPPMYTPYGPLHSHTDLLGIQQQMASSFCQRVYPHHYPGPVGLLPVAALGGGLNKRNGSVSCSNCGMTGHYTHDCAQPSIDSSQQGGFRLKYAAPHISETPDKAEGAV